MTTENKTVVKVTPLDKLKERITENYKVNSIDDFMYINLSNKKKNYFLDTNLMVKSLDMNGFNKTINRKISNEDKVTNVIHMSDIMDAMFEIDPNIKYSILEGIPRRLDTRKTKDDYSLNRDDVMDVIYEKYKDSKYNFSNNLLKTEKRKNITINHLYSSDKCRNALLITSKRFIKNYIIGTDIHIGNKNFKIYNSNASEFIVLDKLGYYEIDSLLKSGIDPYIIKTYNDNKEAIMECINNKVAPYREFKIPKRNGKLRTVRSPIDPIRDVTNEILPILETERLRNQYVINAKTNDSRVTKENNPFQSDYLKYNGNKNYEYPVNAALTGMYAYTKGVSIHNMIDDVSKASLITGYTSYSYDIERYMSLPKFAEVVTDREYTSIRNQYESITNKTRYALLEFIKEIYNNDINTKKMIDSMDSMDEIVKIDLKDFFNSITFENIKDKIPFIINDKAIKKAPEYAEFIKYISLDNIDNGNLYIGNQLSGSIANTVISKAWNDIRYRLYKNRGWSSFIYADDIVIVKRRHNNKYIINKIVESLLSKERVIKNANNLDVIKDKLYEKFGNGNDLHSLFNITGINYGDHRRLSIKYITSTINECLKENNLSNIKINREKTKKQIKSNRKVLGANITTEYSSLHTAPKKAYMNVRSIIHKYKNGELTDVKELQRAAGYINYYIGLDANAMKIKSFILKDDKLVLDLYDIKPFKFRKDNDSLKLNINLKELTDIELIKNNILDGFKSGMDKNVIKALEDRKLAINTCIQDVIIPMYNITNGTNYASLRIIHDHMKYTKNVKINEEKFGSLEGLNGW